MDEPTDNGEVLNNFVENQKKKEQLPPVEDKGICANI